MSEADYAYSVKDRASGACITAASAPAPSAQGTIGAQSVVVKKDYGDSYSPSFDFTGLAFAASDAMFKSLVCVEVKRVSVGTYVDTNGKTSSADRRDWVVRVLSWPSGALVAERKFQGGDPPEKCSM